MTAISPAVVLITGASSGFGMLTAVALARRGHRVFATMRDPSRDGGLRAACRAAGTTVEVLPLDVTDETSVKSAIDHVLSRNDGIDVLVNNAGYALVGCLEDLRLDQIEAQFATNLFGPIRLMKAVLPSMRRRRHGRIINISSMGGRTTFPLFAAYHSSKWALEGLSEALAYELRPFGIEVILVEPGSFRTDFSGRSLKRADEATERNSPYGPIVQAMEAAQPRIERMMGDPARVAALIQHVVEARRPRLRYVVGSDAKFILGTRALLGAQRLQKLVARQLGIHRVTVADRG